MDTIDRHLQGFNIYDAFLLKALCYGNKVELQKNWQCGLLGEVSFMSSIKFFFWGEIPFQELQQNAIDFLKSSNVNVNVRYKGGFTPLSRAAYGGYKDVVEFLIAKGADIKATDEGALLLAAHQGHKEIVELLITRGANIELAAAGGHAGIDAEDYKDYDGWTALLIAAKKGRKEIVELLINHGANIETANKDGWTALYVAADMGHKDVVEFLIAKGADIKAANECGLTALWLAVQDGHNKVIKLLIKRGADIKAKTDDGETILDLAVKEDKSETVALLCKYQELIDISKRDDLVQYIGNNIDKILAIDFSDLESSMSVADNIIKILGEQEKVKASVKQFLSDMQIDLNNQMTKALTLHAKVEWVRKLFGWDEFYHCDENKISDKKLFKTAQELHNKSYDHIVRSVHNVFAPVSPVNKLLDGKNNPLLKNCLSFLEEVEVRDLLFVRNGALHVQQNEENTISLTGQSALHVEGWGEESKKNV